MSITDPSPDFRAQLLAEQGVLVGQLQELGFGNESETGPDYDANFADTSQVTAERGETDVLVGELRSSLQEIERALQKIEDGSYGICERCGKLIAADRLEAMPATALCISCASLQR
ncbi:MAG TPA: TraR/DksA C4-type zinc finger protein [Acidimicrobiales bacterium]